MRKFGWIYLILTGLLGCASAPKPPECKGEFKPINVIEKKATKLHSGSQVVSCTKGDLHGIQG
jgi:hypothetical protein